MMAVVQNLRWNNNKMTKYSTVVENVNQFLYDKKNNQMFFENEQDFKTKSVRF